MLVFSGLGLAPGQGSTSSRCTMVNRYGVCIKGTTGTNYGGWGGSVGGFPTLQSAGYATDYAQPTMTFQQAHPITQITPTSTPPAVQPGFPSNAVPLPPQVAVPPAPAPSQQPPPVGLPEQPTLQPGVQVTDQSGMTYEQAYQPPYFKLAIAAVVAALAGAGLGVVVRRRRAQTA